MVPRGECGAAATHYPRLLGRVFFLVSFMYIMNTYDVWFTREGPVGSGDHRCLHVLESSRDQALEALRKERVRAVNVEFLAQTGWDRSVYLTGRSPSPGTG